MASSSDDASQVEQLQSPPPRRGLLLADMCLQTFTLWASIYLPNAFFPLYATSQKGLSVGDVGYIYSADPLFTFLATLWFGAFISLFPLRRAQRLLFSRRSCVRFVIFFHSSSMRIPPQEPLSLTIFRRIACLFFFESRSKLVFSLMHDFFCPCGDADAFLAGTFTAPSSSRWLSVLGSGTPHSEAKNCKTSKQNCNRISISSRMNFPQNAPIDSDMSILSFFILSLTISVLNVLS